MDNDLNAILADDKTFAGTMELDFGGGHKYTLQALRDYVNGDKTKLQDEWGKVNKAKTDLTAANEAAANLYQQAQALIEQANNNKGKGAAPVIDPNDPLADYAQDATFGPLVRVIQQIQQQFNTMAQANLQAFQQLHGSRTLDRWERQYESTEDAWKSDDGKTVMSFEEAIKFANDNGHVDPKTKIPDLKRAAHARLDVRSREEEIKKARLDGEKEGKKKSAITSVPAPGGGNGGGGQRKDIKINPRDPFGSLLEGALSDPDVLQAANIGQS